MSDMIPVDADFSKYKMVVAPVLYMVKPGMKEALEEYVRNGGILVTTYMSGIVGAVRQCISGRISGTVKGDGRYLGRRNRCPRTGTV